MQNFAPYFERANQVPLPTSTTTPLTYTPSCLGLLMLPDADAGMVSDQCFLKASINAINAFNLRNDGRFTVDCTSAAFERIGDSLSEKGGGA